MTLLTFAEATAYLRVSRPTIYRLIESGQITPIRLRRRVLFAESALEELIRKTAHGPTAESRPHRRGSQRVNR